MKQFLLKTTLYALFIFLILNTISWLCLFSLSKSSFYKPQFIENGIEEKEFDYVVLGSSTGLTTLDTKLIDSILNKRGLNISMDDSGLSSHYLMLRHFYALQKKTKYLILVITPWDIGVTHPALNENDYRFLPYVNRSYVFDYYKDMEKSKFKLLSLSKYFPIFGVAYYNTELFYPSLVATLQPEKRNKFDDRGNYSYPISLCPQKSVYDTMEMEMKNPYFIKIKQFCVDNNIKLLIYQSPLFKTKVIAKYNPELINNSDFLRDSTMFYDNIHVNSKGRRICSEKFANYLLNL